MDSMKKHAIVLLGLLVMARSNSPEAREPLNIYPDTQADKQIGAIAVGIGTITLSSILTRLVINLVSSVYNYFFPTMLNRDLPLVTIESLLATPSKGDSPSTEETLPDTTRAEPPNRRPYVRSSEQDNDKSTETTNST